MGGLGPILKLANGWRCYPLGDGSHVMVGMSGDGPTASVVTLARPERCEVVTVGGGLTPAQLVDDLTWIGQAMTRMQPRR